MPNPSPETLRWRALDKAHHAHPFTDPASFQRRPVQVITRAEGVYVWNSEGEKLLDGMAGLWCVNVGYGRKEIADAVARQFETLSYYNTFFQSAAPAQIELAARLAELTPGDLNHFFFACSGSEANDTVMRLVRRYWAIKGRPEKSIFISRNRAYHGSTLAGASLGGMAPMHAFDHHMLEGFEHVMEPHWYVHGGDLSQDEFGLVAARKLEERILEVGADKIAAFIGEPVQGAGGVIDPPATYWREIERICRRHDILLIADEVICGFGRLGEWFGCQHFGFTPDLMSMAKGLSSGYQPISAVAISDAVYATLAEGGPIAHGFTYSAHPACCAAALANIDLMERERLVPRAREEAAPYFHARLAEVAEGHPLVGELRGRGLLAAFQLSRDPATRATFEKSDDVANVCRQFCLDAGLIVRAIDQAVILCPPLVISHAEMDELAAKVRFGLDQTAKTFGLL